MDKKGFTLVEVIVVLVILAILAAVLIPTLTGYIDKANERVIVSECRAAVMAAQTLASESYGMGTYPGDAARPAKVKALAEVPGTVTYISLDFKRPKVNELDYKNDGYECTYTAGAIGSPGKYAVKQK